MDERGRAPEWALDLGTPNVARMYDYYLGGKDHFAADRAAADRVLAVMPHVQVFTRANREFLARAVTALAASGVRQFLDIGSGLPTRENVHEVAQRTAPGSRVVYVDRDPVVLRHAEALLAGSDDTTVVRGDLREPCEILASARAAGVDFSRPVAVLLLAILHFIPGDEETAEIVSRLLKSLCPGSYLVVSHGYAGTEDVDVQEQVHLAYRNTAPGDIIPRPHATVLRYFAGLELLGPGLVPVAAWRHDAVPADHDLSRTGFLGAVGRVP